MDFNSTGQGLYNQSICQSFDFIFAKKGAVALARDCLIADAMLMTVCLLTHGYVISYIGFNVVQIVLVGISWKLTHSTSFRCSITQTMHMKLEVSSDVSISHTITHYALICPSCRKSSCRCTVSKSIMFFRSFSVSWWWGDKFSTIIEYSTLLKSGDVCFLVSANRYWARSESDGFALFGILQEKYNHDHDQMERWETLRSKWLVLLDTTYPNLPQF